MYKRQECTSRKLKDDEDSVTISNEDSVRILNQYLETISNQYSVTISNSILGDNNIMKTIYENENNDVLEIDDDDLIYGDENKCKRNAVNSCQNAPKRGNYEVCQSVQGTFHQADIIFEDNAGTQCVANCLAALAYHKLKSAKYWSSNDMNQILMTGDELYTYLQRSSSIHDRYLLVEELPEHFECFNMLYQFHLSLIHI